MDRAIEIVEEIKQKLTDAEYMELMDVLEQINSRIVSDTMYRRVCSVSSCRNEDECTCAISDRLQGLIDEVAQVPRWLKLIAKLSEEQFN